MGAMQQMMLAGKGSINLVVPSATGTPTGSSGSNGYASLSFTAPTEVGTGITSYTVASSPGGFSGSGSNSPITVSGLSNGTTYSFTVTATNSIGTGPASSASAGLTPSTVPDAPTIGSAAAGNTTATISFTPPGYNGGAAISSYIATSSPGGITGTATSSPITVSGLSNGTSYTFTVVAQNISGNSSASAASNAVTPNAATVPSAPTIGTATGGNGSAYITFTQSASDGGSTITGYTATSTPGNITGVSIMGFPITVNGLTNGTTYSFTVHATNAIGNSSESAASNSVQLKNAQISSNASIYALRTAPGTATAKYSINASGNITRTISATTGSVTNDPLETWLLTGSGSDFEVRFTTTAGDPPSTHPGMGTWLSLSSDRFIQNSTDTVADLLTSVDVEIRPAGGGSNYGVVSISIEAEKQ